MTKSITVADMALEIGVDPDAFHEALRGAKFPPRKLRPGRVVEIGSDEYSAMRPVLVTLLRRTAISLG